MPPVSHSDSIKDVVGKMYGELKDGVEKGSIDNAMKDINNHMADMTPKDWAQARGLLLAKVNSTAQMLPELSILATENAFSGDGGKLEGRGTITDTDVLGKISADQSASAFGKGKTLFEQDLLQAFLPNEYAAAKAESGGWFANSASMDDLNKDLADKTSNNAALTTLEKNDAAGFTALADDHLNLTRDTIQTALDQDATRAQNGLAPKLDSDVKDLANKLLKDDGLFDRLSHKGDTITLQDLDKEAVDENAAMGVLRRPATPDATQGSAQPQSAEKATKPNAVEKKSGPSGDGQKDGKQDQQPNAEGGAKPQPHGTAGGGGAAGERHGAHVQPAHHKSEGEEHKHTVKHGDNLWQIARHRLIEEDIKPTASAIHELVTEIAAQNRIANPDVIRDGQVLQF